MTVLRSPLRVLEAELIAYRRTWRGTVISSFVNPVLFLSAMGLSLGSLVDGSDSDLAIPYLAFVASGLMAAAAMQAGASDGAFPVMAGIKWRKSFLGAITTPVSPGDIVLGRFLWAAVRLTVMIGVFAGISVLFGAFRPGPALAAIPPSVLTGLAFLTTVTAFTVTREDETSLSTLFRFGIVPLFLFSGTFFPISRLPAALEPIAYLTPLFHGVELVRKVALPGVDASVVTGLPVWAHLAYLVGMTTLGLVLSTRFLDRRLKP